MGPEGGLRRRPARGSRGSSRGTRYLLCARRRSTTSCAATTRSRRAATTSTRRASTSARAAGRTTCCRWSTPTRASRARSCATRSTLQPPRLGPLPYFPYGIGPLCTSRGPRHVRRPRRLAAPGGRAVRARVARHAVLRRAPALPALRAVGSGVAAREARLPPPGVAARAAWRLPRRLERRLVRLLGPVPRDERVAAHRRAARLRLSAASPSSPTFATTGRSRTELRRRAGELRAVLRDARTAAGWYLRGYGADGAIGRGAIFGEPQPWAILAGVPSAGQSTDPRRPHPALPDRRRRAGRRPWSGADRVGDGPAFADPDLTEHGRPRPARRAAAGRCNAAAYLGGAWFDVNGWLTWALGELDGVVPAPRPLRVGRVHAQHARGPRDRLPAPLGRDDLDRRRVLRLLLERSRSSAASTSTTTTTARSPSSPRGW